MILPKFNRSNLAKGLPFLAFVAMAGVKFTTLGDSKVESLEASMLGKTELELDGIIDPLFEELFDDKYHRALEEYTSSKGLFTCNDICQVHKRRLNIIDRELNEIQRERQAARKAVLQAGAQQRLQDTQARIAANLERRQQSLMSSEERISVRKAVRKAERDAERAAAIAAYRAELGVGDPLTLEQKQARAAAAKEARIAARLSRKTPEEAAAEAYARQEARWYEYLNVVAQSHGFADWTNVEQFLDMTPEERDELRSVKNSEGILEARSQIRAAARHAVGRTPAPTTSPTPAPTLGYVPVFGNIQNANQRPVGSYFGTADLQLWDNVFHEQSRHIEVTACSSNGYEKQTVIRFWRTQPVDMLHYWAGTNDRYTGNQGREEVYDGVMWDQPDMRIYPDHISCSEVYARL